MFLILTLGLLSVVLALILTPVVRDVIGRHGFLDHPDGFRKMHAAPIPRVGGIAIVLAYTTTFAIAFLLPFSYTFVLRNAFPKILELTLVTMVVFLTGVLDDLLGLTAWQKLMGLCGAGAMAYFSGIRVEIHWLHSLPAWPWLGFALTVLWLVGCANAFNLIDGMDGLASGVGLLATVTMLIVALIQGNLPLALATLPLAGSLLGFLPYNFNPASIFLGDSGSLVIGFLLGCFGALWSEKSVTLVALTVPLLAVAIPLLDVALSILRRYLCNRPIFQADRGHIHHKLLDLGLSPKNAVLTIYAVCAIVAVLSLTASALHNQFSGLVVILLCGAVWMCVRSLKYTEFEIAGRMFLKGNFRRIIDSETRLTHLEKALAQAENVEDCCARIREGTSALGLEVTRMNLGGLSFESAESTETRRWQLRIALGDGQYVDFSGERDTRVGTLMLNGVVDAVDRGVRSCIERRSLALRKQAEEATITVKKRLYYTASAATAGSKSGG